ncbi:MAG: ERAP1-like C-terminal domain-containing protein, partial [Acidobacteria bacterium]|nr:ERAP1-like C-terminal domain-containing protein [Acidobacteriota bacterium]
LVDRALQLALSPKMRSQDTAGYLVHFLGNPSISSRAWAWVKEHWPELEPKVMIFGGDTRVISSLSSFCDASSRDDIAGFVAAHPLPGAARTLSQTIERINDCIALKATQTPLLTEWLARKGDGSQFHGR